MQKYCESCGSKSKRLLLLAEVYARQWPLGFTGSGECLVTTGVGQILHLKYHSCTKKKKIIYARNDVSCFQFSSLLNVSSRWYNAKLELDLTRTRCSKHDTSLIEYWISCSSLTRIVNRFTQAKLNSPRFQA